MPVLRTCALFSAAVLILAPFGPRQAGAASDPLPIPVRHPQGAAHVFLVLRSEAGAVIGYGELSQLVRAGRLSSRLTYHFRDGSLDDETTVYTEKSVFHVISDHHIQRGPFFSKAIDSYIEENGRITTRTFDKEGKEKVETSHIDLPADLANGITGIMLLNVRPDDGPVNLGMVVPSGKGRLIRLAVTPAGNGLFSPVTGVRRNATVFRIHPELGGVAGVVAPLVGKQPEDIFVWVLEGEVPGLVREIGQLAEGGPIVSVEPAGASYPAATAVRK